MIRQYLRGLSELSGGVPEGSVVVHNLSWKGQELGQMGFRAWLQPLSDREIAERLYECECEWASGLLDRHFRVWRRAGG